MFDQTVPPLQSALSALSRILDKAGAHCESYGIDPAVLVQDRLYPDMLPFSRQVQLTCDFAARLPARLAGRDVPSFPDVETTLPELKARIAAVQDYLAGFAPADFAGVEDRQITLKLRSGEMTLSGRDYHRAYALPQVYFHMTTAYNILRHNGVPLGKRDYMGA